MPSLRATFIKIYGNTFSKFLLRRGIRELSNQNSDLAAPLISALNSVMHNDFSREECEKFKKINKLREDLMGSKVMVKYENLLKSSIPDKKMREEGEATRSHELPIKKFARIGKSGDWALLLFMLIRKLKPENCLEMGTCLGFSAAYQASAIESNKQGELVTLEGQQSLASIARENFEKLDLKNIKIIVGLFQDTLGDALKDIQCVDYAFIDGHHDERATIEYFNKIYPYLSHKAVLVFDDISWSKGMRRAWNTISRDKRVELSLDLRVVGICVLLK